MLNGLNHDAKFAMRTMRRSPGFTTTVVLIIAIAIAANATIFTVVNTVMIRPLPFHQPDRIVQVAEKNDRLNLPQFGSSVLNFIDWRREAHSFQDLAGVGFTNFTLTGNGEPEQCSGNQISPGFLRVLGVDPILGRAFSAEEELPGASPVAILSEGLWRRRFGADPSLVGRTITLNGASTLVVGIAPAAMRLIYQSEIYTPLKIDPSREIRLNHVIVVFGRLKQGVSVSQAQSEMDTISQRMGRQYPEIRDWGIRIITLHDTFVSPELKTGLAVLQIAVGLVLLIACANIANLLLARAATRESEMAVRTALGATRAGLVRQLLVESLVLSATGGVTGLLGALGLVRLLDRTLPPGVLPLPHLSLDANVLWFACALTLAAGILFGLAPALRNAMLDPEPALRDSSRTSVGGRRGRFRDALMAVELALATVLLIGAGLLIQTLARLETVALGFDSHGLITFQLAPPAAKYPAADKLPALYRSLLESLRSIPGARAAAVTSSMPFDNSGHPRHPMFTTGPSVLPSGTKIPIDWSSVSPGFYKMMHVPLLAGRDFTDADGPNAEKVIVVSQSTARKFWGGDDPIGKALRPSARPEMSFSVIGVVGDVHDTALDQETPQLYYSVAQWPQSQVEVAVRSQGNPEDLLPAIREKVHELDAELAVANVSTEDEWIQSTAAQPRFNTGLLTVFAGIALLMAAIGTYGVISYSVTRRTREIGLRMALGAQRGDVLRLILSEGMKVALVGVGIGLAGGLALGRFLASLLFGITARDPATFGVVTVLLIGVALAACILPARRAARVDPMAALRCE